MSEGSLAEAHRLSARLHEVVARSHSDFAAIAAAYGLTPLQARTLLTLQQPVGMRQIADRLCCDASNVTGLADRLEKLGVVERAAGDDRRVKLLQLTAEGERLRRRLAARVGRQSTVMRRLTGPEREQLSLLLAKLLAD